MRLLTHFGLAIFMVLLALAPLSAQAQIGKRPKKPVQTIVLDYQTRATYIEGKKQSSHYFSNRYSIPANTSVGFKIININLLRFQPSITSNQVIFDTGIPSFLGTALLGKSAAADPSTAKAASQNITAQNAVIKATTVAPDKIQEQNNYQGTVTAFTNAANSFVEHVAIISDIRQEAYVSNDPVTALQRITAILKDFLGSGLSITKPEELSTLGRNRLDELFGSVKAAYRDEQKSFGSLPPALNTDTSIKELHQSVTDQYATLATLYTSLDDKITSAQEIFSAVQDGTLYSKSFGPITATGDEIHASATITSLDVNGAPKPGTPETLADFAIVPVHGQFRISGSIGPVFSTLTNPTYYKDANGNAQQNTGDKFSPTIAGFLHFPIFPGNDPNVSTALSIGVAQKDSTEFFLGGSIIVGREQRIALTFGMVTAQVNRLSGLSLGDPVKGDQPTTKSVYRNGLFFGITYNIK